MLPRYNTVSSTMKVELFSERMPDEEPYLLPIAIEMCIRDRIKDASAAAIYGARAAYGVVLVTTKEGDDSGKTRVSYSGRWGWNAPTTSTDYETRGYYSVYVNDPVSYTHLQVTAESGVAVELQITVDLEEMEMRTDLNRAVAGIAHDKLHGLAAGIVLLSLIHISLRIERSYLPYLQLFNR